MKKTLLLLPLIALTLILLTSLSSAYYQEYYPSYSKSTDYHKSTAYSYPNPWTQQKTVSYIKTTTTSNYPYYYPYSRYSFTPRDYRIGDGTQYHYARYNYYDPYYYPIGYTYPNYPYSYYHRY